MDKPTLLTREGYQKLETEYNHLLDVRRKEVAERLHRALEEGGELVENAEYEDAKNEQAFVEGRIAELERILNSAQLINETNGKVDEVILGSHVTVQEDGESPETYHLIGAVEANPRNGKISNESPLGKALLGAKVGDTVTIQAPDGSFSVKVVGIK